MMLEELIRIPSPSREEGAAADYLEAALSHLGVRRKGNNLWMSRGKGPAILMDAHIDTVRPVEGWTRDPFEAVLEGDRLYGLGANDDGGSLQAMIEAFSRIRPSRSTLILSLSAEEEVSGSGGLESMFPLWESLYGPIRCGIIGEPTGMRMATQEKGLLVVDCLAHGKAGHAARNEGVNAIYEALPDILWLKDFGAQVTQIQAGTQHNVLPDGCRFVADIRTTGDNIRTLEALQKGLKCSFQPRSTRLNGSRLPSGHPLETAAAALGIASFSSSTLSNQALCPFPTVKIGPGDSARSHTADEYICLSEIREAVDLYCHLYENLEQRL